METLLPPASGYTVTERAERIYNGVLDIFDYNASNDVTTPLTLARHQVRQIPTRSGNVLIPGAGIGTYVLACLLEGFSPEQITAVEINPAYLRLGFGIFSRFGVNYLREDYLTFELPMKFDVIIGNPPYQDSNNKLKAVKLWPKFIECSLNYLKEGGYISMVTPSTWLTSRTGNGRKVREALTLGMNLVNVDTSAGSYFKVGVGICQWIAKKEKYSGLTQIDNQPYDLTQVYASEQDRKLYEIFAKVLSSDVVKLPLKYTNTHLKKGDLGETGKYEVHFSGPKVQRTDVEIHSNGVPKLVAPWSCSYKKIFYTTKPTGIFNCWFECSEENFESYKAIWDIKIVRLMCEQYKKTCGFTPAVEYGLIPDFRFMTDEEVYGRLNLTQEEINLVEKLVKS